jgi:hypothetical protein
MFRRWVVVEFFLLSRKVFASPKTGFFLRWKNNLLIRHRFGHAIKLFAPHYKIRERSLFLFFFVKKFKLVSVLRCVLEFLASWVVQYTYLHV